MRKTEMNNTVPNWAFRGWLASLGVVSCAMLFIFVGHAQYKQSLVHTADAAKAAEFAVIAQEYTNWRISGGDEKAQAASFLEVAEATSRSVSKLVSFDFKVIEQAEIKADERRCLAEAIYHEAGFEPVIGRMAVADVVLNRVKSPQYPDSICGVVYQGSHRTTGCQFSFTCDGSLNRRRHQTTFTESDKLAGAILAGVHLPVSNNATHYHADYVKPYWAPKLTPTAQIGAHKFYKFPNKRTTTITAAAQ